jgi:hypothetical protein
MTISPSFAITRLVIAVVAALAVTLCAATVALADAKDAVTFEGKVRGDTAFFDDIDGESFRVCDRYRDRMPVGLRFSYMRKNGTRQTGSLWHKTGVDGLGNSGVRGCSASSHNFGERRRVWFQTCIRHVGGALTCSPVEVTVA